MLKTKPILKILSIIPRSRYLAIAIFYDADLRDWRIKDIREKGIKNRIKKAKKILSYFIERYEPHVLAIKKLDPIRSSPNLNNLARQIKEFARRKGLRVCQLSLPEIKASIAPGERINKKDLAELVVSQYPELLPDLEKEQRNRNAYYLREFEAVALGLACFYKLDGKFRL